jgi:phosphoglycolate phosphatase
MHIRALIFDLDGTLLNSLDDLADAANAMLSRCGFSEHPVAAYRYFVGDGLMTLIERILPEQHRSPSQIAASMELFAQIYGQGWDIKSHLYAGVAETLRQLRQEGLRLAILSNKPHAFTQLCVQRFFDADCFDFVHGQREGVPKKPDPQGAEELAALMQLPPAQILYVGDTATDMRTGNEAGMKTLGVLWGFRQRQELEASGAGTIITHPSEIVEFIHRVNEQS